MDAGRGIEGIVAKLNQSSGNMGSAMEGAIDRLGTSIEALKGTMTGGAKDTLDAFSKGSDSLLATMNSTLAEIAQNTGEGARALNEAAEAMSRSAVRICTELEDAAKRGSAAAEDNLKTASQSAGVVIQDAGKGILEAFAKASAEVGEVAKKMTDSSSEKLLAPLTQLSTTLSELVRSAGEAARHTQAASQGMQNGADAANSAAASLRGSAQTLNQASNPIAVSVQSIELSSRALENSTASIAESSRANAQSVAIAIKSVADILAGEQTAIQATLKLLESCIERMRGQGDRLDEMEDKLGNAFEGYRTEVQRAMDSLEDHVRKIQEQFTPALSTLQTLVEQIEEFAPSSRRK
jgi:DNA repair exonuclease SbcCD ATPase subunit